MVLERIGGGMVRLGYLNSSLGLQQGKLLNLELLQPTKAARIRAVTLGSNFTARISCQISFCQCKSTGLELVFSVVDLDFRAVDQLIGVKPSYYSKAMSMIYIIILSIVLHMEIFNLYQRSLRPCSRGVPLANKITTESLCSTIVW